MGTGRYLKVAWLYLIGVIISLYGVYTLIYMKDSFGMNSFYIMIIGIVVTGIGSFYGKRKLRSESLSEPGPSLEKFQKEVKEKKPEERNAKVKEKIMNVLLCPNCGKENEEKNKFCWNCGQN